MVVLPVGTTLGRLASKDLRNGPVGIALGGLRLWFELGVGDDAPPGGAKHVNSTARLLPVKFYPPSLT